MSNTTIKILSREEDSDDIKEILLLTENNLKVNLKCFTGQQGEVWVTKIPSLNIAGYGQSEKESTLDVSANIEKLALDLFKLSSSKRKLEIRKLGWSLDKFFKKKYTKTSINEIEVIEDFDFPEEVKKFILESSLTH
ncbi:MAG: hypothetical protein V4548_07955 [Bacteroidota bacterium]